MKRIIAIILACLVVMSLAACSGTDSPTAVTPGGASVSPSVTPTDSGSSATESPSGSEPAETVGSVETPQTPAGGPQYGGTLRIVNTSEGATPLGVPWEVIGIDVNLITPYGEALVLERSNGDIEPWLAESWEVDTNALTITFKLREDVYFHDGSQFNAEVAAWNMQKTMDNGGMNPAITAVSAPEEFTLLIELNRWSNALFGGFATHSGAMISMESFEANGIEWARENPVGTGPFKIREYVHGERIVYEKNEDYWQDGKPYLDSIEYVFIRDTMTQGAALAAEGEQAVDVLNTNSGEQLADLADLDVYIALNSIGPVSLIPSSMHEDSPLSKLEVRQAISCAIDRDALVAARGFGYLTPAYQYLPDTWGAHLPDEYNLTYDQQKAKDLLTRAGYADGFDTTIYAMPNMVDRDIAVAVQSMLQAIGINAEVEFPDSGGYSALRFGTWDGLMMQHTRSLPQVINSFTLYFDASVDRETEELYYRYFMDCWRPMQETYDTSQAAQATLEPDDALLQECHKIILDNMICVPLYNIQDGFIIKNSVHDTGFADWGAGTMFLPADAWKSAE